MQYIKYVTYGGALNKIEAINSICILSRWTDGVTNNYCFVEEYNEEINGVIVTSYLIPILDGYEEYFSNISRDRIITLN
jgi:hypothetical protein